MQNAKCKINESLREELLSIIKDLKRYLYYLKEIGIDYIPVNASPLTERSLISSKLSPEKSLQILRKEIGDCRKCKLYQGRTQIVFGVGNPKSEIVFVGEGPGRDEDLQGEPFVGDAGQLLTKIIESMGLKRQDVYIANVVKCRPPNNRNPESDEIESCEPFLLRQLEIIKPKIICALGTFAAQTLLITKEKISSLRGNFYYYHDIKVMPTFHPAYLLRNPGDKKLVWEDMKKVMKELNLKGKGNG
ncbi:MAG: uracil-DNA glycosylase [Nitrospirota bacterium]